jgi:nitrogen fixation NifU-like protein
MGEESLQDLSMLEYGQNVLDHFLNPRNVGKVENPDAEVKVGDPSCGDYIELSLRLNQDEIAELKYLVFGCIGAISTSSALSELAVGKKIEEAMKITDDDVIAYLKGIPENKRHCSLLGVRGLHEALKQCESNKKS